ncbi:uncharacterized protein LOC130759368 isoform X2 [Actinidia eriantha]|uniref:uncharacterized protein LOC130759368 isoform X2 n=1 Tax=Actinidia eriantha TaxID=165200 RepID=UPI00258816AB|nr:uncharacterized protein LOC130759368 isoform X2 [Actinidia eriantha]
MSSFQIHLTQKPKTSSYRCFLIPESFATARSRSMYPKVKVRELKEDDHEAISWPPLGAFESLSIDDLNSSVTESEDDTPPSVVRIPKSYIPTSAIPVIPLSKGEGMSSNKKKAVDDSNLNSRDRSLLRPRAVLSSPDNDGMIGSRNKAKPALLSGLKDHNLCQNRHTQCKFVPRRNAVETPTKEDSKEAADHRTNLKSKRGPISRSKTQATHQKGKPDPIRI